MLESSNLSVKMDGEELQNDKARLQFLQWLKQNNHNDRDLDFNKACVKDSLVDIYPLMIALYGCVCLFALIGNIGILIVIVRKKFYRNATFFFVANLALSDVIKVGIVLPITLANMLLQNWMFGSFLCYVLPMLHSFPIHATMLTYVTLAIDRYRLIVYPIKSRLPAELCIIAVWVVAIAAVLPYAVYIKYIDIGQILGEEYDGAGICWINIERDIEQYIRAIFVIMYCLPLVVIASLFIKVAAELKSTDTSTPLSTTRIEENANNVPNENNGIVSYQSSRVSWSSKDEANINTTNGFRTRRFSDTESVGDDEVDMRQEHRSQRYLIAMVILFAACWLPINILTIITYFVHENDENTTHYDITYLILTLFGFLSTCTNPVLFTFWKTPESTKLKFLSLFKKKENHNGRNCSQRPMLPGSLSDCQ